MESTDYASPSTILHEPSPFRGEIGTASGPDINGDPKTPIAILPVAVEESMPSVTDTKRNSSVDGFGALDARQRRTRTHDCM
jgi:hypothetical protein